MTLLERARSTGPVWGTFVKLAGDEPIDLVADAGFDFVVVDLEHSQLGEDEARRSLRRAAAIGLPGLVRVAEVDEMFVNRALEAGAVGVQLSGVRSRTDVDALVAATQHPPAGRRSVSLAQPAAGYGGQVLTQHLDALLATPPLMVGQIESGATTDPLDRVLAGLDVAFVGTTDLTVDMGVPGQLDHPAVVARVDEIAKAATAAGVLWGAWAPGLVEAQALAARGAGYVMVASDLQLLRHAMVETVHGLKGAR
ncbi:MAG: hypothetical protein J2P57_21255 [Acidimicrobiaceae bacterium]|nr:hypothetical protein [Acidimicrobiaceae bacterium]